ncbi:MAG: DUF6351 family protein [Gammaproteobacteria bacterium]|nr:DUF6351 family protein [Gammaproteobacteria bacterium]MDP2140796.1 DUF6351 family protein [Gammaproteobacteria bacterium]MDP2347542.1 DUF6351 family protein [Gammaproteobacteria bacterium]
MFIPFCKRHSILLPASALVLLLVTACSRDKAPESIADDAAPAQALAISVLSTRPDMITGGDALIRVDSSGIDLANVKVALNGEDISMVFTPDSITGSLQGLVEGMHEGNNTLIAMDGAGSTSSQITLVNHPITGPVISGPHLKPFVCTTEAEGLGEPLDEFCTAVTQVQYFYRSTAGEFVLIEDVTAPYPADMINTTTIAGNTAPFLVRVESGTINRSIYHMAVLDDPRATYGQWSPDRGWNKRLLFSFGGGCGTNYNQGSRTRESVLDDMILGKGFAHVVSSFNVMGHQCNDNLSAETLMMLKEHFIENYGVPVWTVGNGGSGGAIQQLLITQNYPGLLDGLMPSLSFADSFSVRPGVTDCRLLMKHFAKNPDQWTDEKRQAVEGYSPGTCAAWERSFIDVIVADTGCGIPEEMVYNAKTNPGGARCTIYDTNVATVGRDPQTGFAFQALDNTGIQYGLQAFNSGIISADEFIELNRHVGGYDRDGKPTALRTSAQLEGLAKVYSAGRVNSGSGGLGSVPILHYRSYLDPLGDIHDRFRDFQIRERITKAHGRADNQVIWIYSGRELAPMVGELALDTMTQWLDAIQADKSGAPIIDTIVRAKPAAALDGCWNPEGARIDEPFVFQGPGKCNELYPSHTNPRLAAGAPLADDAIKCALKPLDRSNYKSGLSDDQWTQLQSVFPEGVCDYTQRGIAQEQLAGTFLTLPL